MKSKSMRYVTRRRNRDGSERHYWQRPGHPVRRLPTDPAQQAAEAARLNAEADGRPAPRGVPDASWGAVIESYRASEAFAGLAPSSRSIYELWLGRMSAWRDYPVAAVTGRVARVWLKGIATLPSRRIARAVLLNLYQQAIADGLLAHNPLAGLRLAVPKPRDRYVLPEEFQAICAAKAPAWFVPMVALLLYTAQRPGDSVRLAWPRDGEIAVRQAKTRKLVAIPVHRSLAAILDKVPRRGVTILTTDQGKPVSYEMAWKAWRAVLRSTGLAGLQLRDFRRTAVVMMADAGCSLPEIAAVTGHSICRTQHMIDTYWVATRTQAQAGIARWERHKTGADANAAAEKV